MTDATPENWRPVMGYEGWYEVSDHGRVRRISDGLVLKQHVTYHGYQRVALRSGGRQLKHLVHRLVLEAFAGPCPLGLECNHQDGNKANNRPGNLEWATHPANMRHAIRTGLKQPMRGERHSQARLTSENVADIRRVAGTEPTRITAARYGIQQGWVRKIQRGKSWKRDP